MKTVNKYRDKWKHIVGNEDETTQNIVSFLLENQKNYFNALDDPYYDEVKIAEGYGTDWKNQLYKTITKAWAESHLPKMVSVQPMTGRIGGVVHFSKSVPTVEEDGVPTVYLKIVTKEIQAESRKSRVEFKPDMDEEAINTAFNLGLNRVAREVLGTMLNSAQAFTNFTEASRDKCMADGVKEAVQTASIEIHRLSMRGPGNNIVGNHAMLSLLGGWRGFVSDDRIQKLSVLDGRWNVYLDPYFPDNELMVWYNGQSLLDAPLIYSPYTYEFTNVGENSYYMKYRHKITMVRPEFVRIVKLSDLRP